MAQFSRRRRRAAAASCRSIADRPAPPARRVIYSRARIDDTEGKRRGACGFAGFHVQYYFQNRSAPVATAFHRSLVDEGVRFDPDFAVYEDQDFFINCATRTAFHFVDQETCIWHAYAGESGCGHGANLDKGIRDIYYPKLREKWATAFEGWLRRTDALLFLGQHHLREDSIDLALQYLERALAQRPDDVNALNRCGLANYRGGHSDRARTLLSRAAQILPMHAGVRQNLDLVLNARRGSRGAKR
ncbi:MAG: hypothetical protein WBW61_11995 [Rhodanobacteraceae bacterium]